MHLRLHHLGLVPGLAGRPEALIVFGSRARGDARPDSDVDILVVQESSEPRFRRAVPLYTALASLPIEVDVLVYTPDEVREYAGMRQAFVTVAAREGRVIYEKAG